MKVTRTEDQEARKKEGKQQAVRHTYGGDSEDDGEDDQLVAEVNDMIGNGEELLVEESVAVDQLSTSTHHIRIAL